MDVMGADAVELDKAALRRMLALGTAGTMADEKSLGANRSGRGEQERANPWHAAMRSRVQERLIHEGLRYFIGLVRRVSRRTRVLSG